MSPLQVNTCNTKGQRCNCKKCFWNEKETICGKCILEEGKIKLGWERNGQTDRPGLELVCNVPWLYLPKDSEIIEATNPIRNYYLVKILYTNGNDIIGRGEKAMVAQRTQNFNSYDSLKCMLMVLTINWFLN